jgi:hypothetical protein
MSTSSAEVELRKAMRYERKPAAFVGSGLSNYGSWEEFVLKMAKYAENEIGMKFLLSGVNPDLETLLAIADESLRLTPSRDKKKFLENCLHPRSDSPTVYGALVRAPFAFYLTTNYDTNIEDAYREHWGTPLQVMTSDNVPRVLRALAEGTPFVFKIHGCIENGGNIVIGSKDYQRAVFGSPAVQSVLHAVFATHSIVFMGYGHRDPHISMYLGYQRQILPEGGPVHFTFVKKDDACGYDQKEYFVSRFGIECIQVDEWSDIEVILDQLSFLQLRDEYVVTRRKQAERFQEFIKGKPEAAWGALLYAHASSDTGRAEDCFKLWEAVQENRSLRKKIESRASLHLVFCLVIGKILNRRELQPDAEQQFETVEYLARNAVDRDLIRPLRSLGLRHAGIFWHSRDPKRAELLLSEAEKILGTDFPEDLLDHKKWAAEFSRKMDPHGAATELLRIAGEADKMKYLECSAWCRYGAVKALKEGAISDLSITLEDVLMKAIVAFEQLEHMRGLADGHFLLAQIWHDNGKRIGDVQSRLELARSMAVIAGYKKKIERCDELLKEIIREEEDKRKG